MPKEVRQIPLTAYLEPTLWALHQKAVKESGEGTSSSYIRKLIINDLMARKILTPEMALKIYEGTNFPAIVSAQAEAVVEMPEIELEPVVATPQPRTRGKVEESASSDW